MNLDKMSLRELTDLNTRIAQAIHDRKKDEKRIAKIEVMEIAARHGLSLRDLMGVPLQRKKRVPSRTNGVLHRNPADPTQTWSGRGRPPKWFKRP